MLDTDHHGITDTVLREVCERAVSDLGIAGAQVALTLGDTLLHAEVGTANTELGTPVTPDTLFQIGSTTKVYTAVLVLRLADDGLVDIDRAITRYLPGVQLAPGDEWRSITPRQLMSMTSGLDNGPYTDTGRGDDCVARQVGLMADIPLIFPPGSAFGYSNASTNVSGLLVEALTGQCWDDALRDRLLEPAGLAESASLLTQLPYHRVALGGRAGTTIAGRPWSFSRGMGPAGSTLATSARDLARFGRLFLRRGVAADGTRLLSESAVATMQTSQVDVPARVLADNWCVGPYRKAWGGTEVFGHLGTTENGSSLLNWIPEHDISLATIVNTPERGYPFAEAVGDAILRDRLGLPKPLRPVPAQLPVDATPYVGHYEAWGHRYHVEREHHGLMVTLRRNPGRDLLVDDSQREIRSMLRPIAPHRFLPDNDAITGFHTWDIAFTLDADARAMLLHNGAFAARRVH